MKKLLMLFLVGMASCVCMCGFAEECQRPIRSGRKVTLWGIDISNCVLVNAETLAKVSDCKYVCRDHADFEMRMPKVFSPELLMTRGEMRCLFVEYLKLHCFDFSAESNGVIFVSQHRLCDELPMVLHDDTAARERLIRRFGFKECEINWADVPIDICCAAFADWGVVILPEELIQRRKVTLKAKCSSRDLLEVIAPKGKVEVRCVNKNGRFYTLLDVAERRKIAEGMAEKK